LRWCNRLHYPLNAHNADGYISPNVLVLSYNGNLLFPFLTRLACGHSKECATFGTINELTGSVNR